MIEYRPSRTVEEYLRYEEGRRYVNRFLSELGRPRKAVGVSGKEVVLTFDRPGGLSLVPVLIELAGGALDSHTLHQVEEFEAQDGWWGDLEPGSLDLFLERTGDPFVSPSAFRYEPPPFKVGYLPSADPDSVIRARLEDARNGLAILSSTAQGFVSLAKLIIYLVQPGAMPGLRVRLDEYSKSTDADYQLSLWRAEFSKDVPWAKPPPNDAATPFDPPDS